MHFIFITGHLDDICQSHRFLLLNLNLYKDLQFFMTENNECEERKSPGKVKSMASVTPVGDTSEYVFEDDT